MNTKFFKTGLPIMAFMMAIAFAFASENKMTEEEVPVIGYINQNNVCTQVVADCDEGGSMTCTFSGLPVHASRNASGTCSPQLLTKWP